MRLLLDSHAFLWFVWNDPRLSRNALGLIQNSANEVFLSMAGAWELAIKASLGKLTLAQPLATFLPNQLLHNDIHLLPIALPHVLHVSILPLHHRDPFDRLIVAQSLLEAMPLVSADVVLDRYGVQRLW